VESFESEQSVSSLPFFEQAVETKSKQFRSKLEELNSSEKDSSNSSQR
jgi:hypothetical protein